MNPTNIEVLCQHRNIKIHLPTKKTHAHYPPKNFGKPDLSPKPPKKFPTPSLSQKISPETHLLGQLLCCFKTTFHLLCHLMSCQMLCFYEATKIKSCELFMPTGRRKKNVVYMFIEVCYHCAEGPKKNKLKLKATKNCTDIICFFKTELHVTGNVFFR